MAAKIGDAPNGEASSVTGTEKLPISGSKYTLISTIAEYIRTLAQTLTNKTLTTPTIGDFTNSGHNHSNAVGGGTVAETSITFTDVTTNNVSTTKHGYTPKLPNDATKYLNGTGAYTVPAGGGSGDVVGPASAADNAITRYDSTTGKLIQNSSATVDDNGTINIPTGQTYNINGSAHTHAYAANSFSTIAVSGQSDVIADSSADTLTFAAGSNVTLTTDAGTDTVTIAASSGNAFGTVAVSGQSNVVADAAPDTLTLVAGSNVTITTDAGTDSVTINMSGVGGITGPGSSADNAIARFDGTGGGAIQNSGITISDGDIISFPDNVTQTFNPGADNAGINVGSYAGDPATPDNGDLWYDSTANELTARINGANVALSGVGAFDKKSLTSGDLTTTSSSFVDISSSLNITITTGAHRCRITLIANGKNSSTSQTQVDVDVDGSRLGQAYGLSFGGGTAGVNFPLSFSIITDVLSAASHTFKPRWRVDGNTGTLYASTTVSPIIFMVEELGI